MTPAQTITVAVDGSPAAENAVRWACALVRSTGGQIRLLHVVPSEDIAPWPAIRRMDPDPRETPASAPAIEAALRIVEEETPGVTVTQEVLQGPPGAKIVDAAKGDDLLVLGRKARRRPGWLRPGSTSHGVVDGARCPVVLVPGPDGKGSR